MRFSARSPSREKNDANAYVTGHSNSGAGSDIPIGWPYNPSTWFERLWLVAAALVGFAVSGYLALYQLGYFSEVWEPLFGTGSAEVLHSALSRLPPIPDAALGQRRIWSMEYWEEAGAFRRVNRHHWYIGGLSDFGPDAATDRQRAG